MRIALAALALLAVSSFADRAKADPYTWCAVYTGKLGGGGWQCWFTSYQQCRATVSGIGGHCIQNPRSGAATEEPVRRAKKRT